MPVSRLPFEIGRMLVLVGIGVATAPLGHAIFAAMSRVDTERMLWPTLGLAALTVVFVVVALAGRLGDDAVADQPLPTLVVEGVLAAALGLVPPTVWLTQLGLGNPLVDALLHGRIGILAGVWLAVVLVTAVRVRRARKTTGKQAIFT